MNMIKTISRTLILNKNGQFTITLPRDIMITIGAKAGDKFKFIYQPKHTLKIVWMGCDAN